jgi:hypothetical protein
MLPVVAKAPCGGGGGGEARGGKNPHTACWRGTSEPTILILAAVLLPPGHAAPVSRDIPKSGPKIKPPITFFNSQHT